MNDKARRDASTGWFHGLANHDRGEIARRCSPQSVVQLQNHVALCSDGHPLPANLTPQQFAEVLLDLRANELDWERAWLAAAVKADDLMLAGQMEEAVHVLNGFAQTCPWIAWRQAALTEAELIGGRGDS